MLLRKFHFYRTPLIVTAAVLVPLLVYRANVRRPSDANFVDKIILALVTPVERALSASTRWMSDGWYRYVDAIGARAENIELRRRVAIAERERDELANLDEENRRLRALLALGDRNPSFRPIAARVIGAGTSALSRTLTIDRGSIHGIVRGQVVLGDQGLVGVVQRAAWTSSEVVLLADERMSVGAIVVRSRARGRVLGRGRFDALSFDVVGLERASDLAVGDRVATSGLGSVFPVGVPIGEIVDVRDDVATQKRDVTIRPHVDFNRVEFVSVLLAPAEDRPLVTPEHLLPAPLRSTSSTVSAREARDVERARTTTTSENRVDGAKPGRR